MAYSPTAAVAQASGRTSGERAMNATNVSSCSTVTALPPARAGSAVGRRHSHAPTYPSAATMSRARTPTISRGCSRPVRATVKNAAAMKTLSAVGSRTALARVSEVCREQKFAVGQQVFKEGEPGNRLFIISEGEVRISRTIPGSGEEALAVLKPGACFGEMAIFDRSERSTDAIANTSCTLLTIARSDFELLLDFNRDIAYKVLWSVVRLLSARLRVANDNLRSFLAMSMF